MARRGQPDDVSLAAKSCASVKKIALANSASAVGATWVEPGGGDEVCASDTRALGDCISQRSNRIVPHELRKELQFALLLGHAHGKTVVPFRPPLTPQSSHDRQSLTRKFSERPNCAIVGLENAWRIVTNCNYNERMTRLYVSLIEALDNVFDPAAACKRERLRTGQQRQRNLR
jgi:hypothetical protein